MKRARNPGRVAGVWYLLLVLIGPLQLIYIPSQLFVHGNAAATATNIAAHELLFRVGMALDTVGALILIFLTLAFYRLFKEVDQYLAVLVILFGGVMPATLMLVNVVTDAGALMIARGTGAEFLSVFDKPQRDALVLLLLRLHEFQITAAEILWGAWLFPLGMLVFKSRFMPRFLGVWLVVNGAAYVVLSLAGFLYPGHNAQLFLLSQPALFGELALMLWLVVKGARPPAPAGALSASTASPAAARQ